MKQSIPVRQPTGSLLILVIIACLSFAARIYPLSHADTDWAFDPDSIGYVRLADGFRAGCGFAPLWQTGRCGPAEVERTPGYPLFLSVLRDTRTVIAVQAALGAAVCFLVAFFAWKQWGIAAGIIAESIVGLDLSSIINNSIGTELLFTSLITAAILLLLVIIRRTTVDVWFIGGVLSVGCLLGLAELVRPIGQVLLIIIPLGILSMPAVSWPNKLALSLLALSLPLAVIGGWSYRNYSRRGIWTFSSIGAVNLYYYRAAGVLARDSGHSLEEVQGDLLKAAGRQTQAPDLWSKTSDEDPAELASRGMRIVASHPWNFALMTIRAFTRSSVMPANRPAVSTFLGHRLDQRETNAFLTRDVLSSLGSTLESPWLLAIRALLSFQLALTIFTWIGVGLALRRIHGQPWPVVWPILIPLCASLLLLAAAAGPEMNDRFRVPAMPMLALMAAFGWAPRRARMGMRAVSDRATPVLQFSPRRVSNRSAVALRESNVH